MASVNKDLKYTAFGGSNIPLPQHEKQDGSMLLTGENSPLPTQLMGSTTTLDARVFPGEPINVKANLLKVPTPTGFRFVDHPLQNRLYFDPQTSAFQTDFDVSELDPNKDTSNKTILYVDPVNGSGANGGTSESDALDSAITAYDSGADVIMLMDGEYDRRYHSFVADMQLSRDLTIKAVEGHHPILTARDLGDAYTWTLSGGYTNVYETNRSSVSAAYDTYTPANEYDDYTRLVKQTNVADVEANPGSWYTDGTKTYVHLPDSRQPAVDGSGGGVVLFLTTNPFKFTLQGAYTLYMEGVEVHGYTAGDFKDETGEGDVYGKNMTFKYGVSAGGAKLQGLKNVIFQGCEAAKNEFDGFNYHRYNGNLANVIEINCVGRHNDSPASSSNNGTTMHDGGVIIRISGRYFNNHGGNVADVNDKTQSWNMGVVASHSTNPTNNLDYQITSGSSEMWLDHCVGYSSDVGLYVGYQAEMEASKAYVRSSKLNQQTIDGKLYEY